MSFIELSSSDLVNVPTIDNQHENIAVIVNALYDCVLNVDKKKILARLKELMDAVETHFETEERLMKETHFQGYISHKLEHDRFYRQIVLTIDQYAKGTGNLGLEQLKSVKTWFFNHIEINDKKCGKFLFENGIS